MSKTTKHGMVCHVYGYINVYIYIRMYILVIIKYLCIYIHIIRHQDKSYKFLIGQGYTILSSGPTLSP